MGLGAELIRLGRDRLDSRAAAATIPRTIESVTPAWLGSVLGAPVAGGRRLDRTAGTTDRARFELDVDPDAQAPPGSRPPPRSVFVKLAPRPVTTRLFVGMVELGATEVAFYQRLRPGLPIAAPSAYAARYDPGPGRFALVLEDLAARGCRFADVRGTPTPQEAESVVVALSTLHAAYGPGSATDLSWVCTHAAAPAAALTARLLRAVVGRLRRTRPELFPAGSELLTDHQRAFERRLPRDGFTLLHGDPHYGNVYFDGDTPGFFDWQVLRRGLGLRDLAYFLTVSLPTDRRRADERALVGLYLEELARHGGPPLDVEESWRRYRLLVAYAFTAAAFTLAAGGLQAAEIAQSGLERATAAMTDLDTMAEVRRLLA